MRLEPDLAPEETITITPSLNGSKPAVNGHNRAGNGTYHPASSPFRVGRQAQAGNALGQAGAWFLRHRHRWVGGVILALIIQEFFKRPPFSGFTSSPPLLVAFALAVVYYLTSANMGDFFLWCAGVNMEAMERARTERNKYIGFGVTILMTAIFASLSGGYALYTVFHDTRLAAALGFVWGCAIFGIDRLVVMSARHPGSGTRLWRVAVIAFWLFLPRVLLSLGIGLVVAKPLELKLQEGPIEAQLYEDREQWVTNKRNRVDPEYQRVVFPLEAKRKARQAEAAALKKEVETKWNEFYRETEGKNIGGSGVGLIAKGLEREVREMEARNKPVLQQLATEMSELEDKIAEHTTKRDKDLAMWKTELKPTSIKRWVARTDFLQRFVALEKIKRDGETGIAVSLISNSIMLLIVLIEMCPTLMKMVTFFGRHHLYDDVLNDMDGADRVPLLESETARLPIETQRVTQTAEHLQSRRTAEVQTTMHHHITGGYAKDTRRETRTGQSGSPNDAGNNP